MRTFCRRRSHTAAGTASSKRSSPLMQERHLTYNHVVANAAATQNVIDLTRAPRPPSANGLR